MPAPAESTSLGRLLAQAPLEPADAAELARQATGLAAERWGAGGGPSRFPLDGVRLRRLDDGTLRLEGLPPAAEGDDRGAAGPVPPVVRAVVRLLCAALGRPLDEDLPPGADLPPELPPPLRPLIGRALLPDGGGWPLRSLAALREALLDALQLHDPGGTADPAVDRMIPAAVVRRVQRDAPGAQGPRDALWCCFRFPDGHPGQAVLTLNPGDPAVGHLGRTFRSLWPGAGVAVWALAAPEPGSTPDRPVFALRPETLLVVQPRRLFEATAVAAAHEVLCPFHFLAGLREGVSPPSAPILGGRLADLALRLLLETPERRDDAVAAEALRGIRAETAWLTGAGDRERLEAGIRAAVPRIRAWLDRHGTPETTLCEVTRLALRFGFLGRADALFVRDPAAPLVGEMKSGRPQPRGQGPHGGPGPRTGHAAQALLYALAWTSALRAGRPPPPGSPPPRVDADLFYVAAETAFRLPPDLREAGRLLAARNGLLDALRRAAEGERLPARIGLEECHHCWRRPECPWVPGAVRVADGPLDAYLRRFEALLVRSVHRAQGARREALEPRTLADRVEQLTAEPDLVLETDPHRPRRAALAGSHRSAFRPGTDLMIHRGDPAGLDTFFAQVEAVEPARYRLRLDGPLSPWAEPGPGWIAEEARRSEDAREGFEGLARLRHRRDPALAAALLGRDAPAPPAGEPAIPPAPFAGGWHAAQREAFARALGGGTLEVVQGPPGTGKTLFVGTLAAALVGAGRRVALAALTHGAVDLALRRAVAAGTRALLRVGARERNPDLLAVLAAAGLDPGRVFFEEAAARAADPERIRALLFDAPLLAATCHRFARLPWRAAFPPGGTPPFDVAIIDEATQIPEPTALAVATLARRTVLVGDPKQLSCVVPDDDGDPIGLPPAPDGTPLPGLGTSLLERLAAARGAALLRRQHRMHARIMAFPNRAFYDGALEAAPEAAERLAPLEPRPDPARPRWLDLVVRPDEPLVLVDVAGGSEGRRNPREADRVATAARALVEAGLPPADLGVVTPYRAQAALIRRLLAADPRLADVPVDTVDRFQGDERTAVLVSLAGARPTGHLAHPNRINVTLTRARSKLVVFGDVAGLSRDPLLRRLAEQPETARIDDE